MKTILFIIIALIIGCILYANLGEGGTTQCDVKYEWTVMGEYVPVWHCHTIDNDGGS